MASGWRTGQNRGNHSYSSLLIVEAPPEGRLHLAGHGEPLGEAERFQGEDIKMESAPFLASRDWNSYDSSVTRQEGRFTKGQNMFRQRSVVARKKDVDLHSQIWTIVSQFWESIPHKNKHERC